MVSAEGTSSVPWPCPLQSRCEYTVAAAADSTLTFPRGLASPGMRFEAGPQVWQGAPRLGVWTVPSSPDSAVCPWLCCKSLPLWTPVSLAAG